MWNVMGKGVIVKEWQFFVFLSVSLLVLLGCQDKKTLMIVKCDVLSVVNEYPDSSFFSDISSIHYQAGNLYVFDRKRGDVAVKDMGNNSFFTIGQIGQGPFELANSTAFTVCEDGRVMILDAGNLNLKCFEGQEFVSVADSPSGGESHFFMYQDTVYMSLATDTTCYVKLSSSWKRGDVEGLRFCGKNFHITEAEDMNLLRNRRHLIKGNECLYAICPSYPVVEKYDLHTDRLLETIDLSKLDYLNEIWDYITKEENSPKSFYIFLQDACFYDGKLYILFASWKNGYAVNKILALDDNKGFSPLCIYQLPGDIYKSFTIVDNKIYAFNYENAEIQTICFSAPY